jgi:hypothetical protein
MKKLIGFLRENEQALTFTLVIAYLSVFVFYFIDEMRTNVWYDIIWIIQFFALSAYMGLKWSKKN